MSSYFDIRMIAVDPVDPSCVKKKDCYVCVSVSVCLCVYAYFGLIFVDVFIILMIICDTHWNSFILKPLFRPSHFSPLLELSKNQRQSKVKQDDSRLLLEAFTEFWGPKDNHHWSKCSLN